MQKSGSVAASKNPPREVASGGSRMPIEDAYFDALIHTPTPGHSNSSDTSCWWRPSGWVWSSCMVGPNLVPRRRYRHEAVCSICGYSNHTSNAVYVSTGPATRPMLALFYDSARCFSPRGFFFTAPFSLQCVLFSCRSAGDFNSAATRILHIQIRLTSGGGCASVKTLYLRCNFAVAKLNNPSYSEQAFLERYSWNPRTPFQGRTKSFSCFSDN